MLIVPEKEIYVSVPLVGRARVGARTSVSVPDYHRVVKGRRWCWTHGYACTTSRPNTFLHRKLMGLTRGDGMEVDHINRNGLDNRRHNLRVTTRAENGQNLSHRPSSSRFRGVTWDKARGKWKAQARLNYKRVNLGRFDTEDEAGAAASRFRAEHMPFSEDAACR